MWWPLFCSLEIIGIGKVCATLVSFECQIDRQLSQHSPYATGRAILRQGHAVSGVPFEQMNSVGK